MKNNPTREKAEELPIYKKALKVAKNKAPDWPTKDLDGKPKGKSGRKKH